MKEYDAMPPAWATDKKAAASETTKHPWVTATESARKGELPDGTTLDEATVRMLKVAAGLEKPQNADEAILLTLGTMPLFLAGGAGAAALATRAGAPQAIIKAAPMLGRMMTSAGLSRARGESGAETALDVAGAGLAEGAMAVAGKLLSGPAKAAEKIRERIGKGDDGAVNQQTFDRLLAWWKRAEDQAEKAVIVDGSPGSKSARGRIGGIVPFLRQVDPAGVAAKMFKDDIASAAKVSVPHVAELPIKVPRPSVGASQAARSITSSPVARSAADAAFGQPIPAALALSTLKPALEHMPLARSLPGVRDIVEHE